MRTNYQKGLSAVRGSASLALHGAAFIAAMSSTVLAQAPDSARALRIVAEKVSATGVQEMRAGTPAVLRPGDEVRYRLTFTNITADSVRDVRFNDPIPAGLHYVAGSAGADRGDVRIEFSIDGGKSYSTRPEIEEVVNGQRVRKPAPAERFTHVQWSIPGWVRPRAKVESEFRVQLAATPPSSRAAASGQRD